MRRLVVTTLLTTALLAAAACGTKAEENPTAATTSSAPAAALDRTAWCTAFTVDMTEASLKGLEVMGSLLKAENDPALAAKVVDDIRAMFAGMQTTVEKHMATAPDAELKAAITELHTQVKARRTAMDAAGQDVDKLMEGMDDASFEAASDKLDKLCA